MVAERSDKKRRGPAPLPAAERRLHPVQARFSAAELEHLDEARKSVGLRRGAYLRAVACERLPRPIPAINREAWAALARAAGNLNQIARHLNAGDVLGLPEVRAQLDALRLTLIGAQPIGGEDKAGR